MNIVIPKPVNEVLNLLYDNNYEGYIVGAAARNMYLGEKPTLYTISTDASVEEVKKILKDYETHYSGQNNSSLTIENNKFPMEITQYRTKENTLEDDLASRDFTMNALAYSDEDGLIDYNDGIIDINNRVIRVNGTEDEIFVNDPLRIIRAIRLSAEYRMRIDPQTIEYMFDNKDLLSEVAPERIRDELSKLLVRHRCDFYLKKYFDIFLEIIPELALMEGFNQNDPHHIYDVLEHTFVALKCVSEEGNLELSLATLLHDIAKPLSFTKDTKGVAHYKDHAQKGAEIARGILNRLKFNKKTIQKVTKLVEYHDYEVPDKEPMVKMFLSKFGPENIDELYKLKKANFYGKNPAYVTDLTKIEEEHNRLKEASKKNSVIKKSDLKITGKDLVASGIKPEKVGYVLETIYLKVINGELKNKHDKLIDFILNEILPTIQVEDNQMKKSA